MGPESTIESKVCRWCRANGIYPLKLAGPGERGKADRMFMRHGRACFVEFKAPGKRPTALQLKWLEERAEDGFPAVWCNDADEAIAWLKFHLLKDA